VPSPLGSPGWIPLERRVPLQSSAPIVLVSPLPFAAFGVELAVRRSHTSQAETPVLCVEHHANRVPVHEGVHHLRRLVTTLPHRMTGCGSSPPEEREGLRTLATSLIDSPARSAGSAGS